jgi:hypothetical protein
MVRGYLEFDPGYRNVLGKKPHGLLHFGASAQRYVP